MALKGITASRGFLRASQMLGCIKRRGPERAVGRLGVDGRVKGFWRISGTPVSGVCTALLSGCSMFFNEVGEPHGTANVERTSRR
jgi:hypothetical protein